MCHWKCSMYDILFILFHWEESTPLFLLGVASHSWTRWQSPPFIPHINVLCLKQAAALSVSPGTALKSWRILLAHQSLTGPSPSSVQGTFPPLLHLLCPAESVLLCHAVLCYPMSAQNSWVIIPLGLQFYAWCPLDLPAHRWTRSGGWYSLMQQIGHVTPIHWHFSRHLSHTR